MNISRIKSLLDLCEPQTELKTHYRDAILARCSALDRFAAQVASHLYARTIADRYPPNQRCGFYWVEVDKNTTYMLPLREGVLFVRQISELGQWSWSFSRNESPQDTIILGETRFLEDAVYAAVSWYMRGAAVVAVVKELF